MFKLYYFYKFDESGQMQILEFDNEENLDKFLEIEGNCIEIFDLRS